jgi:hypothetical protein
VTLWSRFVLKSMNWMHTSQINLHSEPIEVERAEIIWQIQTVYRC